MTNFKFCPVLHKNQKTKEEYLSKMFTSNQILKYCTKTRERFVNKCIIQVGQSSFAELFPTRHCISRVQRIHKLFKAFSLHHLNRHHFFCYIIGDSICYVSPSDAFFVIRQFSVDQSATVCRLCCAAGNVTFLTGCSLAALDVLRVPSCG